VCSNTLSFAKYLESDFNPGGGWSWRFQRSLAGLVGGGAADLGVLVEDAASAAAVSQLARVKAEGGVGLNAHLLRLTVLGKKELGFREQNYDVR
jgi:hypothetical protein